MIRSLLFILAAVVATPPAWAQSYFVEFEDCSGEIGTEFCSPERALEALSGLEPEWGYRFRPAGVDAFAVVTVLGLLKQGIENRIAGGDCIVSEELAYEADDIWAMYVTFDTSVSEGMNIDFSVLEHFVGRAIRYVAAGEC